MVEDSAAGTRGATKQNGVGRKSTRRAQGPRCAELVLLAAMLSSAETGEDRAEPLIAETGIASVLLVSDCFPPPAYDMALCLAQQYKLAMERVGIEAFHDWKGSQAERSDTQRLAEFVRARRPDWCCTSQSWSFPTGCATSRTCGRSHRSLAFPRL